MKICFKCGIEKDFSEFYKHSSMADGYINKCKECTKEDVNRNRLNNIDKVREYDRNRPNRKERAEKNKERIRKIKEEGGKAYKKYIDDKEKWRKQNRYKSNAHSKLHRAISNGIIERKFECERCNGTIIVEAHHEDYSKPLEVIWLCKECHSDRHKELNEIKRLRKRQ